MCLEINLLYRDIDYNTTKILIEELVAAADGWKLRKSPSEAFVDETTDIFQRVLVLFADHDHVLLLIYIFLLYTKNNTTEGR